MKWITHQAAAVAAALVLHLPVEGVVAACAGAVLPDVLDQRMAGLACSKKGRQRLFNAVHRGTTHWPGWWLALCGLVVLFPLAALAGPGKNMLLGLGFGGFSHVLLDMLTPAGVPLTPFSRRRKLSLKLCATGSLGEYCFLACVLGGVWLLYGQELLRLVRKF